MMSPSLTLPSFVDEETLDEDDESSIPPSLPPETNEDNESPGPPSLPLPSQKPSDSEMNDSLLSLLTDRNFDQSVLEVSAESDEGRCEDLLKPEFQITMKTVKTGPKKGNVEKKITLVIGDHFFKRSKKFADGKMVFTCNGCQKEGVYLSAVAGMENEDADEYYLIRAPQIQDHKCWVSGNTKVIKEAKDLMYQMVLKEPTRSLQEIYEVVRQQFTANMDSATKLLFLQDFPKYLDLKSALLYVRRQVIPPDPKLMTDIDVNLPIFLNKDGENIVKADQVLSDGRRIMMFSTNDHLKILARATQVLGDGTFRITPGLWCQTFIISAEVSQGSFVPVSFCLLPGDCMSSGSEGSVGGKTVPTDQEVVPR